jgi:PncC family amidohydrolase
MTAPTYEELSVQAAQIGATLREHGLTCASAESCTGGLIGHIFTENSGSSDYFMGGAITYSNEAKERVLGVKGETLMAVGAVSAEVARQMAQGALELYNVDMAVAVTGVAGPGGGTLEKPVGTVHIHLSTAGGFERGERYVWPSDRSGNKRISAEAALQMIADYLEKNDES